MKNSQQGVGLIEVIVALVILAVAVLGFSAMQLRAVATTTEATNNVYATNIARDLAERLRVNREGFKNSEIQSTNNGLSDGLRDQVQALQPNDPLDPDCGEGTCTPQEMAEYDLFSVVQRAKTYGMELDVLGCQGSNLGRSCVYVAWGDTNPTNGADNDPRDGEMDCTNDVVYNSNAQCVIVEIYNNVN